MNEVKEAVVVLSKCGDAHKTYGIRAEKKAKNCWQFTWAFPIKEAAAKREGYDRTSIGGNIQYSDDYPGCPYCKESSFILCGTCGHINCSALEGEIFTCEWCGARGTVGDYEGEAIKAGSDL